MATFHFKYEAVLHQRQADEDECQRELAKHLRHHNIIRTQLQSTEQAFRDARQQLTGGLVGHVDVERVRDFARYSGQVTAQARQAMDQLQQIERRIDKARADLAEAMRRRKAIQTLRDKHYQQWLAERKRRETIELDELAVQRYARGLNVESI
ncbi:MAG: flagellar export protein FliJ [Phycisphaeraceae bacterium]